MTVAKRDEMYHGIREQENPLNLKSGTVLGRSRSSSNNSRRNESGSSVEDFKEWGPSHWLIFLYFSDFSLACE